MSPDNSTVQQQIESIEQELKSIGFWQSEPLRAEQYDFHAAFALDTMAYSQWLQFILKLSQNSKTIEKIGKFSN